jgi:hypothetical protein
MFLGNLSLRTYASVIDSRSLSLISNVYILKVLIPQPRTSLNILHGEPL